MVQLQPDPPERSGAKGWALGGNAILGPRASSLVPGFNGGVAQLGEHLLCKQGVIGSIPFTSTNDRDEGGRMKDEGGGPPACLRIGKSSEEARAKRLSA